MEWVSGEMPELRDHRCPNSEAATDATTTPPDSAVEHESREPQLTPPTRSGAMDQIQANEESMVAARISKLEAENERLRGALRKAARRMEHMEDRAASLRQVMDDAPLSDRRAISTIANLAHVGASAAKRTLTEKRGGGG